MINQSAQGLASLGRNGDSMLVHMSPEEVGGLQQIGNSLGIKMSTNPHTGMPEAFSFGDFFTSFLPTIVGAAVGGPAGGGLMSSMTPILAGAGTGALLAAAKGDDPLMGGLTGGLGGYGGSQLGSTFGKAFGGTGGTTAGAMDDMIAAGTKNLNPAIGQSGIVGSTGQLGPDMSFGVAGKQAADLTTQALPNFAAAPNFTPITPPSTAANISQNLSDLGSGVKNLTGFGDMSISDAYGKFTQAGGTAADLAMPVGGAVLAGLEPSDLGYGSNLYNDPDKGKYRGPQGQLNLSDRFDTGLRLVAKGGYINGYALGGAVDVNPPEGGGISDLYNRPEGQRSMPLSSNGYGIGRLNNLAGEQSMTQAQTLGYAEGGDVGMNIEKLPTLNVNTGLQSGISGLPAYGYAELLGDYFSGNSGTFKEQYPKGIGMSELARNTRMNAEAAGLNPKFISMPQAIDAVQARMNRRTYASGGYLNGNGDGMSDSIPATIEGKQPARLADGEFVIPADVVSHLGNGSSKAGSKRLYAMLDKVRHARTGNKKQGKEIKAEKYLPA
jgi:hypothetical protein